MLKRILAALALVALCALAIVRTTRPPHPVPATAADTIFSMLMGDQVAPRRNFIETHAKEVKFLDV